MQRRNLHFPKLILLIFFHLLRNYIFDVLRNFSGLDAVDATLTSGASGEDVVDACIDKLNHLDVFPNDFGLMKRIAKVESDFGQNYGAASPTRGIWQVGTAGPY